MNAVPPGGREMVYSSAPRLEESALSLNASVPVVEQQAMAAWLVFERGMY